MAKSKKPKSTRSTTVRTPRDHNSIATPVRAFMPSPAPPLSVPKHKPKSMIEVEDRRTFHFDPPGRPALKVTARPAKMILSDKKKKQARVIRPHATGPLQTKAGRAFEAPKKVIVCVRRAIRRAVIMATLGGGKITRRKPRRTSTSDIRC